MDSTPICPELLIDCMKVKCWKIDVKKYLTQYIQSRGFDFIHISIKKKFKKKLDLTQRQWISLQITETFTKFVYE